MINSYILQYSVTKDQHCCLPATVVQGPDWEQCQNPSQLKVELQGPAVQRQGRDSTGSEWAHWACGMPGAPHSNWDLDWAGHEVHAQGPMSTCQGAGRWEHLCAHTHTACWASVCRGWQRRRAVMPIAPIAPSPRAPLARGRHCQGGAIAWCPRVLPWYFDSLTWTQIATD